MGARGRTPASALNVVDSGITPMKRPEAPDGLTPAQKETWREIVNRLPVDWFPKETHSMLEQMCRHISCAKVIAWQIALMESPEKMDGEEESGFDIYRYHELLKMQERESRAITALARSMRITQQSTYDAKKTKGKGVSGPKPWETQTA